jgi:hypothetical protein
VSPIGGSWGLFSRMRIIAGGQVFEAVVSYNRAHAMFRVFSVTYCSMVSQQDLAYCGNIYLNLAIS